MPPKTLPKNFGGFDDAPSSLPSDFGFNAPTIAQSNARLMRQNAAYEANPPENRMPQPNAMQRFGTAALDDTSRLWEGLTGGNEPPTSMTDLGNPAYYPGMRQTAQLGAYLASNDSLKHKAANLAAANPEGIEESSRNRDYASLLGHTLAPLAAALLPGRVAKAAGRFTPPGTPATAAEVDAGVVSEINKQVNPPAKEMPDFRSDVGKHLPDAIEYAKGNGIDMSTPAGLAQAFRGAGSQAKAYYQSLWQPIADKQVSIPWSGDFTTIGKLEARLKEINATLNPSYNKTGAMNQAAALSNEAHVQLSAEAANIRQMLNQSIGKELGIKPEEVAAYRQRYGAMGATADTIQLASDARLHELQKPMSVFPTIGGAKQFFIDRGAMRVGDAYRQRQLGNALARYTQPPMQPADINPPTQKTFPAYERGQYERTSSVSEPSLENEASVQYQQRLAIERANRGIQQSDARRAEQLRRAINAVGHGEWKSK